MKQLSCVVLARAIHSSTRQTWPHTAARSFDDRVNTTPPLLARQVERFWRRDRKVGRDDLLSRRQAESKKSVRRRTFWQVDFRCDAVALQIGFDAKRHVTKQRRRSLDR